MKSLVGLGVLIAAGTGAFLTLDPGAGSHDLLIENAIVRPLEGDTSAAFLTIQNRGTPDRLIAVTSPVADASLYLPEAQDSLPVPTGDASLALDAAHIQLSAATFEHGELIPLTLTFANAGKVSAKAKLADPAQMGAAEETGLFGLGDICIVEDGEPAPAIALRIEQVSDGWQVHIDTDEFTFSEEYTGLYHIPGMGHGHLYVGGMKLGRLYAAEAHIGALPPGAHEVRVTLNTNDHRAYVVDDVPVTASAVIVVE